MKCEPGRTLSHAVLTKAPEIISVAVVDLNLTMRVSSVVKVAFDLCDVRGPTVRVREAGSRQRGLVRVLEVLK